MNIQIHHLDYTNLNNFHSLFSEILSTEFPGYSEKVVKYFLEKIYTRNAFSYWITQHSKTVFIASVDNALAGFTVIDEPYGGVSFCRWLGVKKDFQNHGIGSLLIQNWFQIATQQDCHKVELAAQPEAKGFYEKVGLILEGERKQSYFGINQYLFGKVLKTPSDDQMVRY